MKLFLIATLFVLFKNPINTETISSITKISDGIIILLNEINIPIRVTTMVCWNSKLKLKFFKEFMKAEPSRRNYLLGIVPDHFQHLPLDGMDVHQELLIVDVNCKNLPNLLNQVISIRIFDLLKN